MNYKLAVLYTTVVSIQDAEELANLVLTNKLAVCVNIIPNGKSIYLWNDKIQQSAECYILFKTSMESIDLLEKFIIKNHAYDIPAILKYFPNSSEEFFNYITNTTKKNRQNIT